MPATSQMAASKGIEITPAQKRGATTRATGLTAITFMASNCSVVFIKPISLVIALPALLANSNAANTGPISRKSDAATAKPNTSAALNCTKMLYTCKPKTIPINKPETATMRMDITPEK